MEITEKICSVDGCNRPFYGLGYCNAHWQQYKKQGFVVPAIRPLRAGRICEFEGCDRPVAGPNYCQSHQKAFNRGEELKPIKKYNSYRGGVACLIEWCDNSAAAKGYCRKHAHLIKFQMSATFVNELFKSPKCYICGSQPGDGQRGLHVDHDHSHCETGCEDCIRGLLCKNCNHALGFFNDDITVLKSAISYLQEFKR